MKLRNNANIGLVLALFAQTCATVLCEADEIQATVNGNARFAFALYREVALAASSNVVISPWSVTCGLVAARIGADGKTASEISKAACLDLSPDALLRGFGFVNQRVQELQDGTGVTLRRATAIWCHPRQPLLEDFVRSCRLALDAKVMDASFDRRAINEWINERTLGKIRDLIGSEELNPLSRLVLVDALYYKAPWQRQFASEATRPGKFTLDSGTTIEVKMMHGEQYADYALYEGAQVLQLPYKGGGVVMLLVLPAQTSSLAEVENKLSVEWLVGCRKSLNPNKVEVGLPAFTMNHSLKLNSALQHLGMVTAFTEDADFSHIDGSRTNLYIKSVLQKTHVEVNEQGTEAAVATGTHWMTRSAEMVESFVCDRPFLFVIYALKPSTILFIGRIADPTQSSERSGL
jgi:serpin B